MNIRTPMLASTICALLSLSTAALALPTGGALYRGMKIDTSAQVALPTTTGGTGFGGPGHGGPGHGGPGGHGGGNGGTSMGRFLTLTGSIITTTTTTTMSTTGNSSGNAPIPGSLRIVGTVTALVPPTITTDIGLTITLTLGTGTTFAAVLPLTAAQLATGETVRAQVTKASDGTLTATLMDVTAS